MLTRAAYIGSVAALCMTATGSRLDAQQSGATIRVGEDRLLSTTDVPYPITEPHLSSHPTDAAQLFVSAMVVRSVRPYSFDCALFSSADGGASWNRTNFGFGMCGNPWSSVLPDRSALVVALAEPEGIARYRADMRVYRSSDGGLTWPDPPHEFGAGFDYPKLLYDSIHAQLYVVGSRSIRAQGRLRSSIVVARSADGGRSFGDTVHLAPSENVYEAQVPVTLSDGTLLVPFTEHHDASGGVRLPAEISSLLVSRDRGRTFSAPRLVAEGCFSRAGWAYLAVDGSPGPYRDRIYWLCARQALPGVWLRRSDDAGSTWSDWVRVERESAPASAVVSAIAVNHEGTIGVMWLSRTESADPCSRLYFSASVDGGASFLPPVAVSTATSCPARDPRNAAAHAHRRLSGGDYNGLAAAADGSFHLVWSDARDGIYRLRHATAVMEQR